MLAFARAIITDGTTDSWVLPPKHTMRIDDGCQDDVFCLQDCHCYIETLCGMVSCGLVPSSFGICLLRLWCTKTKGIMLHV